MRFGIVVLAVATLLASCGPTPQPEERSLSDLYEAAPRGRLPSTVQPTAYRLDLSIDPRKTRFGGTVAIDLDLDQPSSGIWLHGQGLEIKSVRVSGPNLEPTEGSWRDVLQSGVAWIGFPRRLGPGEATVEIEYAARFDENLSGLFRVDEQGQAYALAKSESIQARRFLPGFDEPGFKAPFSVTLTIPDSDIAITNTPELKREELDGEQVRISFKRTRPLSTYLLSLAVGGFDKVDGPRIQPNELREVAVPLTGYTRKGKGADISYALLMTEPMVAFFERELGIPYPYEKLDIIAAPQWPSGATELAAAITYRESRILFGSSSGPASRRSLLNIHSHELAHMWFGDLVTPPWWDDLWLKEAFASWATGIVLSELEPMGGYDLDAVADSVSAMGLDSLNSARAVREPITINEDIRNAYDSITYDKGLAVIAMVDSYFGAETFRPALGRYLTRFADSVADSDDFFEVIGQETNEPDIAKAFRSFVEQSGLPNIQADLSCEPERTPIVTLAQSRYKPLGSLMEDRRRWTVPFCLKAENDGQAERYCTMIDAETVSLPLVDNETCPAWIVPNADGRGYWRFDMDEPQWATLSVNFPALTSGEALTAIDSAKASYRAGNLSLPALLAIVDAGSRRPERQVVLEASDAYRMLSGLVGADEDARSGLEAEIARVFQPRWAGLAESTVGNDRILRSRLESFLARVGHAPNLRSEYSQAARAFVGLPVEGEIRTLSSDDFSTALAIGMEDGGEPFLNALLDSMQTIDDPTFERAAAYAIGQSNDPELVEAILTLSLSGELGTRENYTIVHGQMSQSQTRDQTWSWLQANFPAFVKVIPGQRPRATPRLASGLCTPEGIEQLDELFDRYGALATGYERALAEAKEGISLCVAFKAAKSAEARDYFAAIAPSETVPEPSN